MESNPLIEAIVDLALVIAGTGLVLLVPRAENPAAVGDQIL